MDKFLKYFNDNSLLVNPLKTKLMEIKNNTRHNNDTNGKIMITNEQIERVDEIKFLGVMLDNSLNWNAHINYICTKITKCCYVLRRLSNYINKAALIKIYFGIIHSHLTYGIELWGATTKNNMDRLLKLQKRALRNILNIKRTDSCRGYFVDCRIMTVYSLYVYKTILLTKLNKKDALQKTYQWDTRSKHDFYRLRINKQGSESNPYIKSVILYNKLPKEIKKLEGQTFKTKLKHLLTEKALYCLQEYQF